MKSIDNKILRQGPEAMLAMCLAFGSIACPGASLVQQSYAQGAPEATPPASPTPPQPDFSQQQLDQMLAPIALYPDPLLSQILMAATYPLEVVEAARWSRANPGLQGADAVRAVERQDWDPSVKSLVAFPRILQMMDEKLEWTENLGDAFLGQQAQVMDTIQKLRQKAYAAGNLKSNEEVRVENDGQSIAVVPANRDVIYVPYYDPMVVYGTWWWPDYPPIFWPPWPGYYVVSGFGWGGGIFVTTGFFFGACDWPHRRVVIVNVNNFYYPRVPPGRRHFPHEINAAPGPWLHDPGHRRGVPYRDIATRNRYLTPAGAAEVRRRSQRQEGLHPGASPPGAPGRPAIVPEPPAGQHPETRTRPETRHRPEGEPGAPPVPGRAGQGVEQRSRPESERQLEHRPRVEPQPRPRPEAGGTVQPRPFERRVPGGEGAPGAVQPRQFERPMPDAAPSANRPPAQIQDGTGRGQPAPFRPHRDQDPDGPGGRDERQSR